MAPRGRSASIEGMDDRRDGYVNFNPWLCRAGVNSNSQGERDMNGNACWQLVSVDVYSKVYP